MREARIKLTGEIVNALDNKRIQELTEIYGSLNYDICSSPYSNIPVTFVRRKENGSCHFRSVSGEKTIEDIAEENYYRGMTDWHKNWQKFMLENGWKTEVRHFINGELHIADAEIINEDGKFIVEFEHSKMNTNDYMEIKTRTEAYKSEGYNVLWIFDSEEIPNSVFNSGLNCLFLACGCGMIYYETMDNWEHRVCKSFTNPKIEKTSNWELYHYLLLKDLYNINYGFHKLNRINNELKYKDAQMKIVSNQISEGDKKLAQIKNFIETEQNRYDEMRAKSKNLKEDIINKENELTELRGKIVIVNGLNVNENESIENIIAKYHKEISELISQRDTLKRDINKQQEKYIDDRLKYTDKIQLLKDEEKRLNNRKIELEKSYIERKQSIRTSVDDDVRAEKLAQIVRFLEKDVESINKSHKIAERELHEICVKKEALQKEYWALEKDLENLKNKAKQ